MIKNGSEDGEVGNRSDFSIESLASQVKKMRECLVAEGWEVHKLLPSDWRVKVIANGDMFSSILLLFGTNAITNIK